MTENPSPPPTGDIQDVVVAKRQGLNIVWIIPIVAVLIGGWLWIKAIREQGPEIRVTFVTAAGLEAGKTKVKFKDLEVGKVTGLDFTDDLGGVVATIEMEPAAKPYLLESSTFWVVRPRVGAGGVTGLGTLISGAYIGMGPNPTGKPTRDFTGLELPPLTTEEGGTKFELKADELGSLGIGTPIFYRQIEVGFIERYRLDEDEHGILLRCYVRQEYTHLLRKNSRFWSTSGVRASLTADGFELQTESLAAVLSGGIAFEVPPDAEPGPQAENGDEFVLFGSEEDSWDIFSETNNWVLYFDESVRGLTLGAPVEFRGLKLGSVTDIGMQLDPDTGDLIMPVTIETHPENFVLVGLEEGLSAEERLARLVEMGMRARLQKGSILTGALFIDLDLFPEEPVKLLGLDSPHPEVPTIPSTSVALEEALANLPDIMENLKTATDELAGLLASPKIEETLDSVSSMMAEAEALVAETNRDVGPLLESLRKTSDDAQEVLLGADQSFAAMQSGAPELQYRINNALEELAAGVRSLRTLTDYLERHPEALIKGKAGD